MTDLDKFLFQPKKFEDMISTSKIVIDTNVLLAAYQYRNITFKELINTLDALSREDRLVIPSHVITEFFKNRPDRIVEIIQTVQQIRDGLQQAKKINKIENKIPSMEFLNIHTSIEEIENDVNKHVDLTNVKIKEYQAKLNDLIAELKAFFNHDPILEKYKTIFQNAYFKPDSLKSVEEIVSEFKKREKLNLPPGFKDGKKTANAEGDYIIWEHILQIRKSDVIFITADNKPDWVYKEPNGNVISARRELVEEFYLASEGHSVCIVHPSVFLKAYNPSVDTEVIQDLDKNVKELSNEETFKVLEKIRDRTRSFVNNALLSEHGIPTKRYIVGENVLLDKVIRMLQENDNEDLLFEVLKKADFIASNEDFIDEDERHGQYNVLAARAFTKGDKLK